MDLAYQTVTSSVWERRKQLSARQRSAIGESGGDLIAYARVLNVRSNGFVEFLFSLGDPLLGVELILPKPAFDEFCHDNQVCFLSAEQALACDHDAAKWRFGEPGLVE